MSADDHAKLLGQLDVNRETLLTLAETARRLKVSPVTVWRWVRRGSLGVLLAARKVGGYWHTSEEAIQRFCDAVTLAALGVQTPTQATTPSFSQRASSRDRQIRDAEREFRAEGMSGGGWVFRKYPESREVLCDLHEFIEQWMPGQVHEQKRAYDAVRDGIFAKAAEIVVGKQGRGRSLAAGKAWVESIDLATFNVCELTGVGGVNSAGWQQLLADPAFAKTIRRPKEVSEA